MTQLVGPRKGQGRIELVIQQPRLLRQRCVAQPDVQAVWRKNKVLRQDNARALRVHLDGCGGFDDVRDALEPHPHAGVTAHRPSQQPEIQDFLHRRRKQHRHHAGLEDMVALVRQCRGLGRVVVSRNRQHASVKRGARGIGVLEHVAATIDARPLAVPHAKDAVVTCARKEIDLLRSPYGGRGQILVHARPKNNMVRGELGRRLPEALVQATQRRSAIAGNKSPGVQPGARIAHALVHRQPHQCVNAAQPGPPCPQVIAVLKARTVQSLQLFRRKGGVHGSGLLVGGDQPGKSPAAALVKRCASPAMAGTDGLTARHHAVPFNRNARVQASLPAKA